MTRVLYCKDVIETCTAVFRGETDEEVMRQARAHAEEDHGHREHSPERVAEVRRKIRDE